MTVKLVHGASPPKPASTNAKQVFANIASIQDALKKYTAAGYTIIGLPHATKFTLKEWKKATLEKGTVKGNGYVTDKNNLGVWLGQSGLADIDLDCNEAVLLAPHFLPPTACVFGRPGKQDSHHLYNLVNAPEKLSRKAHEFQKLMIVELRVGKNVTVLPPSIHDKTGELISFAPDKAGDLPTPAEYAVLLEAVTFIAAGSLVLRYWPKAAGIRQDMALALAGGLLRGGLPPEPTQKLIHRIAQAAGDDEAEKRGQAVGYTADKIKAGENVTGWPTLAKLIGSAGSEVCNSLIKWLDLKQHAGMKAAQTPAPGLVIRNADDIKPELVNWLWLDRIAFGEPTMLDGNPGDCKSTIAADLAARASSGKPMPLCAEAACAPINVIFVDAENKPEHSMVPRLKAAGAELGRIKIVDPVLADGEQPFWIDSHLPDLQAAIIQHNARLVIFDPLMNFLSLKVDANSDQHVRHVMTRLARMASETGAAVLTIRHFHKGKGGPAIHKGGGSIGLVGGARTSLVVTRNPDDANTLVLAISKTNLEKVPPALLFHAVGATSADGEEPWKAGKIEWLGETAFTADELVSPPTSKQSKLSQAKAFIQTLLADGAMPSAKIMQLAADAGLSTKTLYRAAKELGVAKEPLHGTQIEAWTWTLPKTSPHATSSL